ncbi:DUF1573 domain-containing protein, partial [Bacteroidales bacterium OttesenSCG-928-B11]|nr:DUF1573 domain-containing protein [Bacteroidales bacterium OttesenSCG-928-B11]
MKKHFLFFLFSFFMFSLLAQPKIKFHDTVFDFDTVREEDGLSQCKIYFTNIGDSTLIIRNLRCSGGMTALYTRSEVMPGDSGFIETVYYPRPGNINRAIRIFTNEPQFRGSGKPDCHILKAKGYVIKAPPTVFQLAGYGKGNGMLRIKNNSKHHYEVKHTQQFFDTIYLRNFWNKPIDVVFDANRAYITESYRSFGTVIAPGQEEFLIFCYDAAKVNKFGLQRLECVILHTIDTINIERKSYCFEVHITEDFSLINKEMAPKFETDTSLLDFGDVHKDSVAVYDLSIKNDGKRPLIIREIASSAILKPSVNTLEIAPGETAVIRFTWEKWNKWRKRGNSETITITTNDPDNEFVELQSKI